ncbi:DNA (cytosine-5-)-methyltransferase [Saccharospirillum sp. MSK14-1]|uniref:DNA (cytosine-5-)-methyltransferase n=1 Tax=Saccharospirillum sp. MSK14-1 TaxID=1897632 RepID=UPI000D4A66E9|nr:DNA (cytosine-5-)-methyltransferase [Saccharospirillum sp. MSK14-1]PTY38588.1 DNA (cytosine-5-)-methyltransferase [Saccharospirillum sp. MSK14-1]
MDTIQKLHEISEFLSEEQIAEALDITVKTLKNWLKDGSVVKEKQVEGGLQQLLHSIKFPPVSIRSKFTYIDLFAGIGGIRRGFDKIGGHCVFTSEWDKFSQKTYRANFKDNHPIVGNISKVETSLIPNHDVLLAGFPCQPFSLAGVSKKNSLGRKHGFEDETQGTLFFDVARIIKDKQPKAFLLENVKNLASHDKGKTMEIIRRTLEEELGYKVHYKIISADGFVPQKRQRIFMVGFREDTDFTWDDFNLPEPGSVTMKAVLHPENGTEKPESPFTEGEDAKVAEDFIITQKLWKYLRDYKKKHEAAGNGFGFGLVTENDIARTLSARYHKDGSEILVSRGGRKNPRRLTPRECARLMGYPESHLIPVSNTQAYRQFGNSVVVPVIEEISRIMEPHILSLMEQAKHHEPEQRELWETA